ncbi:major tail protein [Microbacterium phage Cen1621]|uniref:Major tail protein n=1 Tax=Microbacterium phage Cen1621 TaxID=2965191 RepID=A0A9E7QBI4_9CAUD|nr:major tail protein [Microbacterium phage Cen1621]
MAGNAKNTAQWAGADVYIAPENTAGPTDLIAAWGAGWNAAGLLDGEEGFTEARESENSESYAWGGLLYKSTRSKHKRTFRFVALEDNSVVFNLVNPGSERTSAAGVRTSTIKTPKAGERFAVGFELREGDKIKRRYAKSAEVVEVAEIKESEAEPTVYDITVVVFPESDETLYRVVETDPEGAGA